MPPIDPSAPDQPHPVDRHVGSRLAIRRHLRGLSQTDLARALDLTFQQIQKYERGANRISASKLWVAARFLGVEVDWFFVGLDPDGAPAASPVPEPATRATVEMAQRLPRLSRRRQALVLAVVRQMAGVEDAPPSAGSGEAARQIA